MIMQGIAVGDKIGAGRVHKLFTLDGRDGSEDEASFKQGEVLVTEMTDPDWEPLMKKGICHSYRQRGKNLSCGYRCTRNGNSRYSGCG